MPQSPSVGRPGRGIVRMMMLSLPILISSLWSGAVDALDIPATPTSSDPVAVSASGRLFWYVEQSSDWSAAAAYCTTLTYNGTRGWLATINGIHEQRAVEQLIARRASGTAIDRVFLGGRIRDDRAGYGWTQGPAADQVRIPSNASDTVVVSAVGSDGQVYQNWAAVESNPMLGAGRCVTLISSRPPSGSSSSVTDFTLVTGYWQTAPCDAKVPAFVCELRTVGPAISPFIQTGRDGFFAGFNVAVNRDVAVEMCQKVVYEDTITGLAVRGYVASPTDYAEYALLAAITSRMGAATWIGARKQDNDTATLPTWRWDQGPRSGAQLCASGGAEYCGWKSGEPKSTTASGCAVSSQADSGQWTTTSCTAFAFVVCAFRTQFSPLRAIVAGSNDTNGKDVALLLYTGQRNWRDALAFCANLNVSDPVTGAGGARFGSGYLATQQTSRRHDVFVDLHRFAYNYHLWVGASSNYGANAQANRVWTWSAGPLAGKPFALQDPSQDATGTCPEQRDSCFWIEQEPTSVSPYNREYCLSQTGTTPNEFPAFKFDGWNNEDCSRNFAFVCEVPLGFQWSTRSWSAWDSSTPTSVPQSGGSSGSSNKSPSGTSSSSSLTQVDLIVTIVITVFVTLGVVALVGCLVTMWRRRRQAESPEPAVPTGAAVVAAVPVVSATTGQPTPSAVDGGVVLGVVAVPSRGVVYGHAQYENAKK